MKRKAVVVDYGPIAVDAGVKAKNVAAALAGRPGWQPLVRLPDWLARLNVWVLANRSRPFAWGEWDCVTAAADEVREITGRDVLGGLAWGSARDAMRVLEAEGGMVAAVMRRLGDPIPVPFTQRGDLVLIDDESIARTPEGAVAVCVGEHVVAPSAAGFAFFPLERASLAWRVGNG